MDFLSFITDRVYIRLNAEYKADVYPFSKLTEEVAIGVKTDNNGVPFIVDEIVCNKRVRNYIIYETNRYLLEFNECEACESLKKIFSARQFKKIVNSSNVDRKEISAHIFIVIYFTLRILTTKTLDYHIDYNTVASGYRSLLEQYIENYPNDEIARFALECDGIIAQKCRDSIVDIHPQDLPAIPRTNTAHHDE